MKTSSLIALLLLSTTFILSQAQTTTGFTYASLGNDWTDTCASGSRQSPINIDPSGITCDKSMMFEMTYNTVPVALTQSTLGIFGTGVVSDLFATDIDGILTGYSAQSFVLRAPAEHTIDDTSYDLELQIVHYIKSSFEVKGLTSWKYAIVSILFNVDASASNNAFISALNVGSIGTGSSVNLTMQTLLGNVLPTTVPYYTYQGSFTTPTCTENVNWYVVESIQTITSSQLTAIKALIGTTGNNRALQDTDDRTIKKGNVDCEEQFVYFFSFLILYIFINYFIFKLL